VTIADERQAGPLSWVLETRQVVEVKVSVSVVVWKEVKTVVETEIVL